MQSAVIEWACRYWEIHVDYRNHHRDFSTDVQAGTGPCILLPSIATERDQPNGCPAIVDLDASYSTAPSFLAYPGKA